MALPHRNIQPRFDYMIGESILDKKGVFQASNEITESQLDLIIERFYTGEPLQNAIQSEDEIIEQNVLSISVPRSMFTDDKLENLQKLIEGKQTLMKHAFQAEQLDVFVVK